MTHHKRVLFGALAAWLTSIGSLQATLIPITNPSFEPPPDPANGSTTLTIPPGWTDRSSHPSPPQNQDNYWSSYGYVYDPPSAHFIGGDDPSLPAPADGSQIAYAALGGLSQTLTGVTLQPGATYTYTVAIGNLIPVDPAPVNFRIELFAGATSLGFFTGNAETYTAPGTFKNATVIYTAPLVGTPAGDLRVEFGDEDHVGFTANPRFAFDNVQLDVIPEPSTCALLMVGIIMMKTQIAQRVSRHRRVFFR